MTDSGAFSFFTGFALLGVSSGHDAKWGGQLRHSILSAGVRNCLGSFVPLIAVVHRIEDRCIGAFLPLGPIAYRSFVHGFKGFKCFSVSHSRIGFSASWAGLCIHRWGMCVHWLA